jgi:hypothetical protein
MNSIKTIPSALFIMLMNCTSFYSLMWIADRSNPQFDKAHAAILILLWSASWDRAAVVRELSDK